MNVVLPAMQVERPTGRVRLRNEGTSWAAFHIAMHAADVAAEGSIPEWLDILPTSGFLAPQVKTASQFA